MNKINRAITFSDSSSSSENETLVPMTQFQISDSELETFPLTTERKQQKFKIDHVQFTIGVS